MAFGLKMLACKGFPYQFNSIQVKLSIQYKEDETSADIVGVWLAFGLPVETPRVCRVPRCAVWRVGNTQEPTLEPYTLNESPTLTPTLSPLGMGSGRYTLHVAAARDPSRRFGVARPRGMRADRTAAGTRAPLSALHVHVVSVSRNNPTRGSGHANLPSQLYRPTLTQARRRPFKAYHGLVRLCVTCNKKSRYVFVTSLHN